MDNPGLRRFAEADLTTGEVRVYEPQYIKVSFRRVAAPPPMATPHIDPTIQGQLYNDQLDPLMPHNLDNTSRQSVTEGPPMAGGATSLPVPATNGEFTQDRSVNLRQHMAATPLEPYHVVTPMGERTWQAEDAEHAREQHEDAFAGDEDEKILGVHPEDECGAMFPGEDWEAGDDAAGWHREAGAPETQVPGTGRQKVAPPPPSMEDMAEEQNEAAQQRRVDTQKMRGGGSMENPAWEEAQDRINQKMMLRRSHPLHQAAKGWDSDMHGDDDMLQFEHEFGGQRDPHAQYEPVWGSDHGEYYSAPIRDVDPRSPQYDSDYWRGWNASTEYEDHEGGYMMGDRGLSPLEKLDESNASHAAYDGYMDQAVGRRPFHLRAVRRLGLDEPNDLPEEHWEHPEKVASVHMAASSLDDRADGAQPHDVTDEEHQALVGRFPAGMHWNDYYYHYGLDNEGRGLTLMKFRDGSQPPNWMVYTHGKGGRAIGEQPHTLDSMMDYIEQRRNQMGKRPKLGMYEDEEPGEQPPLRHEAAQDGYHRVVHVQSRGECVPFGLEEGESDDLAREHFEHEYGRHEPVDDVHDQWSHPDNLPWPGGWEHGEDSMRHEAAGDDESEDEKPPLVIDSCPRCGSSEVAARSGVEPHREMGCYDCGHQWNDEDFAPQSKPKWHVETPNGCDEYEVDHPKQAWRKHQQDFGATPGEEILGMHRAENHPGYTPEGENRFPVREEGRLWHGGQPINAGDYTYDYIAPTRDLFDRLSRVEAIPFRSVSEILASKPMLDEALRSLARDGIESLAYHDVRDDLGRFAPSGTRRREDLKVKPGKFMQAEQELGSRTKALAWDRLRRENPEVKIGPDESYAAHYERLKAADRKKDPRKRQHNRIKQHVGLANPGLARFAVQKQSAPEIQHQGDSSLDYNMGTQPGDPWHAQRLGVVDSEAGEPGKGETYYTEGRQPAAAPGTVAFVDYSHPDPSLVYIHYMSTRSDQRGRGHQRKLVEDLIARHPGVETVDFGKEFEPEITHLRKSLQAAHPEIYFRGKVQHYGAVGDSVASLQKQRYAAQVQSDVVHDPATGEDVEIPSNWEVRPHPLDEHATPSLDFEDHRNGLHSLEYDPSRKEWRHHHYPMESDDYDDWDDAPRHSGPTSHGEHYSLTDAMGCADVYGNHTSPGEDAASWHPSMEHEAAQVPSDDPVYPYSGRVDEHDTVDPENLQSGDDRYRSEPDLSTGLSDGDLLDLVHGPSTGDETPEEERAAEASRGFLDMARGMPRAHRDLRAEDLPDDLVDRTTAEDVAEGVNNLMGQVDPDNRAPAGGGLSPAQKRHIDNYVEGLKETHRQKVKRLHDDWEARGGHKTGEPRPVERFSPRFTRPQAIVPMDGNPFPELESPIYHVGKCEGCGRNLFDSADSSGDPGGALGDYTAGSIDAAEYDADDVPKEERTGDRRMHGPSALICPMCESDENRYNRVLDRYRGHKAGEMAPGGHWGWPEGADRNDWKARRFIPNRYTSDRKGKWHNPGEKPGECYECDHGIEGFHRRHEGQ